MKFLKYIVLSLLMGVSFTACSDDDNLGDAPRLFRPVPTMEAKNNNLVVTWDNIKGATSYELVLYKATGEQNEDGAERVEEYKTITVESSPYTFDSVEWDEKYSLKIRCTGNNINSEYYYTKLVSVIYPTNLSTIRTVDVSALITWKTETEPYTMLTLVPTSEEGETIYVPLTEDAYESGQVVVGELSPSTTYKVTAYVGESQDVNTYRGYSNFTTRAAEDFDTMYGEGKYIDLRNNTEKGILISSDFRDQIAATEGLTVILRGGFAYDMSNAMAFSKSVTFRTGLSLEGNAKFVHASAMQLAKNNTVEKVAFEEIDFISSNINALDGDLREWTGDRGFGGKQIFNLSNTNSTVNELSFKNCSLKGFRAGVRLQNASDGFKKVVFDGCRIDGIGDQGLIATGTVAGTIEEVIIDNSTLTNVVMLMDIRASKSKPTFTVSNSTFCYSPVERADNGNPIFRFATNAVTLTIENVIFGPNLATAGAGGSNPLAYTAGKLDVALIDASAATVAAKNSYKTNFTVKSDNSISGLISLSMDEKALFAAPQEEDYTIKASFDGASSAGALKWRMQ